MFILSTAIRAKNRELLDADNGDAEDDVEVETSGPPRKKKKAPEQRRRVLSDDEEEMAAGLASIRAMASSQKERPQEQQQEPEETPEETPDQDEDADQFSGSRGEDEEASDLELLADLQDIDVDEADVDMDLGSGGGGLSNEVSCKTGCD